MSLKLNERYPGRFNNPSAGYPGGSFKNRTTPTAKDGSYLEKDWANDKEGFFQSLLSAAGITANGAVDAVGASQFFDALQALKQIQAGTAFTTAGSAGALTLAPTPAISAYSAPLRLRVKFSQASTWTDTINVSGLGAKNIKQYSSAGAKVAAVFAANQLADVEYDGTDFVLLDRLPSLPQATEIILGGGKIATQSLASSGLDDATIMTPLKTAIASAAVRGNFSNLTISTTGTSQFVTVLIDQITLQSAAGAMTKVSGIIKTAATTVSGLNGIDTGSVAQNAWYSVWIVYNATTGVVGTLLSRSATSPAMPWSGDVRYARIGWVLTDGTANAYPLGMIQLGNRAQWKIGGNIPSARSMASGVQGTPTSPPTYIAIGVSSFVPPTAMAIACTIHIQAGTAGAIAAPSNAYGGYDSNTNPPPLAVSTPGATPLNTNCSALMILESTNIYYASSSSTGQLVATGWEDNL